MHLSTRYVSAPCCNFMVPLPQKRILGKRPRHSVLDGNGEGHGQADEPLAKGVGLLRCHNGAGGHSALTVRRASTASIAFLISRASPLLCAQNSRSASSLRTRNL